jgi:hypothetical protein
LVVNGRGHTEAVGRWGYWMWPFHGGSLIEGYGPGRRVNGDHIESNICNIGFFESIHIPTSPVHYVVKMRHCDVKVLNVRLHNLPESAVGVAKVLLPSCEPLLLNGVAGG